jgi:hypothetical protein
MGAAWSQKGTWQARARRHETHGPFGYLGRVTDDLSTLDMSAFKHVVVPIGVVLGMGLARTMTALANYVQNRDRVRFALAHSLWSIVLFLWFVGSWWIAWGLRNTPAELWSFWTLIFLLSGPCLIFLGASLLLPDLPGEGELDLGERMDEFGRPVFLCLMGFLVWLMSAEIWLQREPFLVFPKRGMQAFALSIFAVGVIKPSRPTTTALGAIALTLVIVALTTVRGKLG